MATKGLTKTAILRTMQELALQGELEVSSSQLRGRVETSFATLKRHLDSLVTAGELLRSGKSRSTRYSLPKTSISIASASQSVLQTLTQPLGTRTPVTYQRGFVDKYVPNETFLLPRDLAESLAKEGRMRGQQPAGTYARKVLEQLLIDLSWSSSRLEGNRFTLLATEELFQRGTESGDADAIMLLNHKRAIEFLVEAVPEYGLTSPLIRNLHSLLMQDLLSDAAGLGEIRSKIVHISDTVYIPSQVPTLLAEMLDLIIGRARLIKNPVEAAFFLWVNIAYLQPFEDGNKRTSRLAANIPLMLYNCAPLSFMDVEVQDYAYAMMGIYELLDTALAADLFAKTYRRSMQKYGVVMESLGAPDPFRLKYREQLTIAIQQIVNDGQTLVQAVKALHLDKDDKARFDSMLSEELASLAAHNCARYRVTIKKVEEWIGKGKPI